MPGIKQSDWDGVYRDRDVDEFFTIAVKDDGVRLRYAFTGEYAETLDTEEFTELHEDGVFCEVSKSAVRDPEAIVNELLSKAVNAVSGSQEEFNGFNATDVEFAKAATSLSEDSENSAYRETLEN